jgi:chromate transport protein ChrA
VAKIYKVFVSTIAFILAVGFMIYGLRLFLMVVGVSGSLDRIIKFVLISTVCSLGLLLQCALLLYSTFKPASSKTDTALAISFTLVVEVLPGLVLIAFMRQPELAGLTWYQDLVWCAYADRDVAISGAGASKSYQSSKKSVNSTSATSGAASGAAGSSGSDLAVGPSSMNSRL